MSRLIIPEPESIGADRLANAAAVAELYGCPAIVIDFGTAATFDVVSEGGRYIGGVIAPGIESMTNFLYQRTALLPRLSLKEPSRAIGKSTVEAMRCGAVFGYRGLVREILTRIKGGTVSTQKSCRRRDWWLCASHCQPGAGSRADSSEPDTRRTADCGKLELISATSDRFGPCSSRFSLALYEENIFPNRTENLRAEHNFDLSGMPIKA